MKKISVLVKQVLMSTLTAGMFAVSFTACSDDSDLMSENNAADNGFIAGGSQLQKPIGLVYTDFINSNDVQILNADTTIISVNKAYADKMGITNFHICAAPHHSVLKATNISSTWCPRILQRLCRTVR